MNYSLFIPSYKRPHEVINNPLLPLATLLLADEEVNAYKASLDRKGVQPKRIITGNGQGIAKARNRIMSEWTDEDFIVMIDDDTKNVRNLMMYAPPNQHRP